MCGDVINIGDYYYSERGKFNGKFFNRNMHVHCHNMEIEYVNEVDNEFSWGEIIDYVQDRYCRKCEHSANNDYIENWEECDFSVTDCPRIIKQFSEEKESEL